VEELKNSLLNKYNCLNSKCSNTVPKYNTMICKECSCSMDIICIDCAESITTDVTPLRTIEGQICSKCWSLIYV